jgi:hypothetical protein
MATLFPTASLNNAIAAVLVPGTTYYASLHHGSPGTTGANEFTGGGYARQAVVFGAASGGVVANNAALSWTNLGTSSADYVGFWTAASGGTFLGAIAASSPPTANPITAAIGALTPTANG